MAVDTSRGERSPLVVAAPRGNERILPRAMPPRSSSTNTTCHRSPRRSAKILGAASAAWHAVTQSMWLPRPHLTPMTGTFRRIPSCRSAPTSTATRARSRGSSTHSCPIRRSCPPGLEAATEVDHAVGRPPHVRGDGSAGIHRDRRDAAPSSSWRIARRCAPTSIRERSSRSSRISGTSSGSSRPGSNARSRRGGFSSVTASGSPMRQSTTCSGSPGTRRASGDPARVFPACSAGSP